MEHLTERPDALKQEIFKILFDSAELSKFTPDERARYQLDMTTERDIHNQIVYARDKGLEEGLAKGLAKGREEGREEGRQEGVAEGLRLVAEQMRKAGITEEDVQRILNDVRGMT